MVDVGFNWYLNKFVKVYFDWEHAMFGSPVVYNTPTGAGRQTATCSGSGFRSTSDRGGLPPGAELTLDTANR